MIEYEPLRQDHLERFTASYPFPEVHESHFGKAVAFINGGEVAALCFLADFGGVVEVGVVQSAAVRMPPLAAHRAATCVIRGLQKMGYTHLRASPADERTEKWLRLLGFSETDTGVFERW